MARTRNTKPERGINEMTEENSGKKEKTVIDISVQRMREENLKLAADLKVVVDALEVIKKERDESRAFLEENERGKAIDALKKGGCTYSVEEFDKMTLDKLDELKQHYRYFKPPVFKSGADVTKARKSVYDSLDDVYVPLETRMKSHQEA